MDESSPEFEKMLERFLCRRCNECCKKPGFVYLKEEEPAAIAAFLKLTDFDFVNQFCELQDRRKLVLKKHSDERCIFLEESGCRIHEVKPQQCQNFPLKWRTPASFDYCEGLKNI